MPTIEQALVRLEPLAVLLPAAHPLAQLEAVPVRTLRGLKIDGLPPTPPLATACRSTTRTTRAAWAMTSGRSATA